MLVEWMEHNQTISFIPARKKNSIFVHQQFHHTRLDKDLDYTVTLQLKIFKVCNNTNCLYESECEKYCSGPNINEMGYLYLLHFSDPLKKINSVYRGSSLYFI